MANKFAKFPKKDLTEVKIFQKVLLGYFFETPCTIQCIAPQWRQHTTIQDGIPRDKTNNTVTGNARQQKS